MMSTLDEWNDMCNGSLEASGRGLLVWLECTAAVALRQVDIAEGKWLVGCRETYAIASQRDVVDALSLVPQRVQVALLRTDEAANELFETLDQAGQRVTQALEEIARRMTAPYLAYVKRIATANAPDTNAPAVPRNDPSSPPHRAHRRVA